MAYTEKAMPVGGLTEEKLGLATATEADVLSGKTFYSGDKELKTGALNLNASLLYSASGTNQTKTYTTTKAYKAIVVFVSSSESLNNNTYHKATVSGTGLSLLKSLTYNDGATRQGKAVIYKGVNIPNGTTISMNYAWDGCCAVVGFG